MILSVRTSASQLSVNLGILCTQRHTWVTAILMNYFKTGIRGIGDIHGFWDLFCWYFLLLITRGMIGIQLTQNKNELRCLRKVFHKLRMDRIASFLEIRSSVFGYC